MNQANNDQSLSNGQQDFMGCEPAKYCPECMNLLSEIKELIVERDLFRSSLLAILRKEGQINEAEILAQIRATPTLEELIGELEDEGN